MKRSYQQECALAYALDTIGERWSLLIVRELLLGPRRFGQLLDNLKGMGTNLLATRMREMQHSGLVEQEDRQYRLTATGRSLEPVVHALVRFGLHLGIAPDPTRISRPEWDCVALRALFNSERADGLSGQYALILDGNTFSLRVADGELDVTLGVPESPQAVARLDKYTALALGTGQLRLSNAVARGLVELRGSRREARRLLKAFVGSSIRETQG